MKRKLRVFHPGVLPANVSSLLWHTVAVYLCYDYAPDWMTAALATLLAVEIGVAAYRLTFSEYVVPMTMGSVEVEDDEA